MTLHLPILYGSVREGRRSIHVARYVERLLSKRPEVTTRLFDSEQLPFGNLEHRVWEWPEAPAIVADFVSEMGRADGFVIVTPEYNYGYPGTLKNLLDHLHAQWNFKPFGLVGAGGAYGGVRAIDGLRLVIPGLNAIAIPAHVGVQQVERAFNEDGPTENAEEWERRFTRFFENLEWYARALRNERRANPPKPPR